MLLAFKIVSESPMCVSSAQDRGFDLALKFLACSSAGR